MKIPDSLRYWSDRQRSPRVEDPAPLGSPEDPAQVSATENLLATQPAQLLQSEGSPAIALSVPMYGE